MKILAIQFRYLGDAVLLTPALRALKEHFTGSSLHVLLAEEIAPVLEHVPWIERVWAFPRIRGSATVQRSWPMVKALRQEHFDLSIDFAGNDRGAIVSLLCGAKQRVGPKRPGGFLGRRFCYNEHVAPPSTAQPQHQAKANFGLLSFWGIEVPVHPALEIRADPARAGFAEELLPGCPVLCHLATSQPKKEWPHWVEFYHRAGAAGQELVFCAGPGTREQTLLAQFTEQVRTAAILPPLPDLATFLAVLRRARLFISGDTGPLHLAAGLGVPTISLFGPSAIGQWAPQGEEHRSIQGSACTCSGDAAVCSSASPCMAAIAPQAVLGLLVEALKGKSVKA